MEIAGDIAERLNDVRRRIAAAAAKSGRDPKMVRLLAVSKTVPPAAIRAAFDAGQALFGENYVQEAKAKHAELPGAELHLIGHLQRNKAKDAVKIFSMIHTVDTPQLAEALDSAAGKNEKTQDILIQVNISGEGTKSGVAPEDAPRLADLISRLRHLRLCGLMCIGTYVEPTEPEELRRKEFRALRGLKDQLARTLGCELSELSMGMSHDYEAAVEEGATIVRVGTAIFGSRS